MIGTLTGPPQRASDHHESRVVVALCAAVAALASVASGAGVFFRGDLATETFISPRGERVALLVAGAYRLNGKNIAAEGVGWDAVTLFLVVPALLATLPGLARGALRAQLLATGLLGYFAYQYLEYAMYLAFGPLFPVYVAAFALSLSGIALLVGAVDLRALPARFSSRFPRRSMVALGAFMALLLCAMWLPLIARSLRTASSVQLFGATTLVVQALDLGLLVPLGIFTALTVFRRQAVGFLLSSVIVVKAVAMATAICAMLVFEYHATGARSFGAFAVFALTALASGGLAIRVYSSIDRA